MGEIDGAWTAVVNDDLDGVYYTYQIRVNGNWKAEAVDPYARAAGTNGNRAQVIDLDDTDPEGWETDTRPPFKAPTDAVIYELHVRDLSMDASSGIENKGKFLGLTERGTTTPGGLPTGLDHLVNLGVTHVHLLPSFDFWTVDEAKPEEPQFNWGYDPHNYNIPEGSYSTDPSDGRVRIREFKQTGEGPARRRPPGNYGRGIQPHRSLRRQSLPGAGPGLFLPFPGGRHDV